MRLWIDGQCLQTASRFRGIGRYVQELIAGLAAHRPDVELMISFNAAMREEAVAARDYVQQWIHPKNIHVWQGIAEAGEAIHGATPKRRLTELAIAYHVECLGPDVALSTSPFDGARDVAVPLLPNPHLSVPVASLFYDAIPSRFPDKYLPSPATAACYQRRLAAYNRSSVVLAISEFAKSECMHFAPGAPVENISTGYPTELQHRLALDNDSPTTSGLGEFILYVGGIDWRKNVSLIVKAFAQLSPELKNRFSLVLAGDHHGTLLEEIRQEWLKSGLPDSRFISLGHVSDRDLVSLYRSAALVAQPSFMEGFGLTALEAMLCGCPVVGSNAGAMAEVIGNPEFQFDPASSYELAALITRVLEDRALAARMRFQGRERAELFTWEKTANLAIAALEKVASPRPPLDLSVARRRIAAEVKQSAVDTDLAAKMMAIAEPISQGVARFIVDATSTIGSNHKTGIQRVVQSIARNLYATGDTGGVQRMIVHSDREATWHRVPRNERGELGIVSKTPEDQILFSGNDSILMLDSSWEYYREHRNGLIGARLRGAQITSCLYDTVPLRFSAFCDEGMTYVFAAWLKSALSYSNGVVCISRSVADELHVILKAIEFPRPMKIGYWRLGADFAPSDAASVVGGNLNRAQPSFLMVGTLEPRKGHSIAISAFEQLWASGVDAKLMIVGKLGWGVSHIAGRLRQHAEFGKRLFWREGVSDAELSQLYNQCDALIAASYAEGFGLPIVEAGLFGKPVVASDLPVFREVAKGAAGAHFFTSGSPSSLAGAVRVFLDEVRSGKLERIERPAWPTWSESGRELEAILLGGGWQIDYQPSDPKSFVSLDEMGEQSIGGPLLTDERDHRLALVEGPFAFGDGRRKFIVRVDNLSGRVWSSAGPIGTKFGVFLGYRVIAADGTVLSANNPRTQIPFVLIPGDSHYLPVFVDESWRAKGGTHVDIELVQEGVAWFGNPLRVPL